MRGLMLAQRQERPPPPPLHTLPNPAASPTDATRTQLHAVLIRILRELNEPVDLNPIRYAQAYGPRRDDTWAARFATRVMQWRWSVRYAPAALVDEVIEVQPHDVHPLDDEGLEVYRILRCTAPGLIHIVQPLHPDTMGQQQPHPPLPPPAEYPPHDQQSLPPPHQRGSSGMNVQQMLGTPLARTPAGSTSSRFSGSDTPRTTPQFPQPQQPGASSSVSGTDRSCSAKRGSEDLGGPPTSKRARPAEYQQGGGSDDAAAVAARAAMALTDQLAIRGGQMEIDAPPQARAAAATEETNVLLRRTLEGIAELGRNMDGMRAAMDVRLKGLDDKLNRILEWVGSED